LSVAGLKILNHRVRFILNASSNSSKTIAPREIIEDSIFDMTTIIMNEHGIPN